MPSPNHPATNHALARQPILNQHLDITGYELLFRGAEPDRAIIVDPEQATASVLIDAYSAVGVQELVGEHRAWINVTREFLLCGLAELLQPDAFVLELLEDEVVDPALVEVVKDLARRGYRIALDDFRYDAARAVLLPYVNSVKLDLLALGLDGFAKEVKRLGAYQVSIVAEKVETYEEYGRCLEYGCSMFQGYFFCRPERLSVISTRSNVASILRLIAELNSADVDPVAVEETIASDPGLTYQTLRYVNSAFLGMRQEVRSLRRAIQLLGPPHLKRWATLVLLAAGERKPRELGRLALVRARFCESAARHLAHPDLDPGEMFTVGILSLIDAVLDAPMRQILDQLRLPPQIERALLTHDGPVGQVLACLEALERGQYDQRAHRLPGAARLYADALRRTTGEMIELSLGEPVVVA